MLSRCCKTLCLTRRGCMTRGVCWHHIVRIRMVNALLFVLVHMLLCNAGVVQHVSARCLMALPLRVGMQGTDAPISVTAGSYTGPGTTTSSRNQVYQVPCSIGSYCSHGVQALCPPGVFGNASGLTSPACSGPCAAGYYCPSNSTSPQQLPCGDVSLYCPKGCGSPVVAAPGEYTVGETALTRNGTLPCAAGNYCVAGVAQPCPGGRFGCANRISDKGCNGPCNSGFFCPPGSASNQQFPCGGTAATALAATKYCPTGSDAPLTVGDGNYSTGSPASSPHQRSGQERCPTGAYCVAGVMV